MINRKGVIRQTRGKQVTRKPEKVLQRQVLALGSGDREEDTGWQES